MENEQNQEASALENARQANARMKKKILLVLGILAAVLVLLVVAIIVLEHLDNKQPGNTEYGSDDFYPTYQGDILLYKDYLDLDRTVSYCSDPSGYGMTSSITDENLEEFDSRVMFLYDFIQILIAGDEDAYNACFNSRYYEQAKPQSAFTPQMIYRTTITYLSEKEENADKLYVYRLEYMIFQNDGTYRRDIASDASRPVEITLRVTDDGQISVEKLLVIHIIS